MKKKKVDSEITPIWLNEFNIKQIPPPPVARL